jgi:hypothetical protein
MGRGHGTPVEAQTVMMARYLLICWLANVALSCANLGSTGDLPSHDRRHETEPTTDSKEVGCHCHTVWGWVV